MYRQRHASTSRFESLCWCVGMGYFSCGERGRWFESSYAQCEAPALRAYSSVVERYVHLFRSVLSTTTSFVAMRCLRVTSMAEAI